MPIPQIFIVCHLSAIVGFDSLMGIFIAPVSIILGISVNGPRLWINSSRAVFYKH